MKKWIDVCLPITGLITITVEAESDEDAIELAEDIALKDFIYPINEDETMVLGIDGNYAELTDDGDAKTLREVPLKG